MAAPFFSIITVSYNPGERLIKTLESILAQTYGDYEVILEDSLSKDGSLDRLPDDARIRVFREKDKGIYDGMNRAVGRASGRYVFFLNCGDYFYEKDTLEKVKAAIDAAPCDGPAVYYGSTLERKTGQLVSAKNEMNDFAVFRNIPCHQACFYDRSLFTERGFELKYKVRADYEHFFYCKYEAKASLVKIPVVIADYEGGGYSETRENRKVSAREHREITGRYIPAGKLFLYRMYLLVSLQPVRAMLAQGKYTAAIYDKILNRHYGLGDKQ